VLQSRSHTAILMREHGIREIYTRDTDFHRFPFLRVVDRPALNRSGVGWRPCNRRTSRL
jgi:hypothetical protein